MAGWEADLRDALGGEGEDLLVFLRDGQFLNAARVPPNPKLSAADQQRMQYSQSVGMLRNKVSARLDLLLLLSPDMPDDVFNRFREVLGIRNSTTPAPAAWLQVLLGQWGRVPMGVTLSSVEVVGERVGFGAGELAERCFGPVSHKWQKTDRSGISDIDEWTARHAELVRPYVASPTTDSINAWEHLSKMRPETIELFAPELARAATASSKNVRAAAAGAVAKLGYPTLRPQLEALVTDRDPAVRALAVSKLTQLAPTAEHEGLLEWLLVTCSNDRSKSVQSEIDAFRKAGTGDAATEASGVGHDPVDPLPDLPEMDFAGPSKDVIADLHAFTKPLHNQQPRYSSLIETLANGSSTYGAFSLLVQIGQQHPEIFSKLSHAQVARAALTVNTRWVASQASQLIRVAGYPTPLELQAVAEHDGAEAGQAIRVVLGTLTDSDPVWADDLVGQWARRQLPDLQRLVIEPQLDDGASRRGLFRALETLPARPQSLEDALITCAITGHAEDRLRARRLLGPAVAASVIPFLKASKVADRTAAAVWLRELKDPSAEKPLREAIAREKQDGAKAQMLGALEALGAPLDDFLSPEVLLKDARGALGKKNAIPSALTWLDMDLLPTVRWKDGGAVDPQILQWFVAGAVRAKTAEPSPLLRLHVDRMERSDAERFAEALFESWLSEDLRPRPREECEAIARQHATMQFNYANRSGPAAEYWAQYQGLTVDQIAAMDLPALLAEPAGSAVDSKGILAVVAAMGGPELVPRAHAFVKKWRGRRLSQGKAMMQMLAWMEFPQAIQVVLTIGQRFRPKGIQEEAHNQVQLLAERRGWTIDDLADRTVPRGGFDDDGRLEISYGTRTFTAHLRDDLTIELINDENGKSIKSLPAPRAGEDEAEVKAIQKELAAVKRELKATAALQPERLHAAMCLQRSWSSDDYLRYIIAHPVMRRLAQRLVWIATTDDAQVLFRPTSDGALITIDDDATTLSDEARVTLAHDELVDEATAQQWIDHLSDYSVKPLFPQFARPPAPTDLSASVIKDFEGHMISTLTLKGQLNKYGWQTGPAEDGGWINCILKEYRLAELQAVVTFTGMPAYNEDVASALETLYFASPSPYANPTNAKPLSKVPKILLREVYGEVAAIAAAGTGFDPDWQKKAGP